MEEAEPLQHLLEMCIVWRLLWFHFVAFMKYFDQMQLRGRKGLFGLDLTGHMTSLREKSGQGMT